MTGIAPPARPSGRPDSADLTRVELTWVERQIENWIRFGRMVEDTILDRRRRVVGFAPGSVFAFVLFPSDVAADGDHPPTRAFDKGHGLLVAFVRKPDHGDACSRRMVVSDCHCRLPFFYVPIPQVLLSMVASTGSVRMRLPVAAKIALVSAGTIGGTPGSPTPPKGCA